LHFRDNNQGENNWADENPEERLKAVEIINCISVKPSLKIGQFNLLFITTIQSVKTKIYLQF